MKENPSNNECDCFNRWLIKTEMLGKQLDLVRELNKLWSCKGPIN